MNVNRASTSAKLKTKHVWTSVRYYADSGAVNIESSGCSILTLLLYIGMSVTEEVEHQDCRLMGAP